MCRKREDDEDEDEDEDEEWRESTRRPPSPQAPASNFAGACILPSWHASCESCLSLLPSPSHHSRSYCKPPPSMSTLPVLTMFTPSVFPDPRRPTANRPRRRRSHQIRPSGLTSSLSPSSRSSRSPSPLPDTTRPPSCERRVRIHLSSSSCSRSTSAAALVGPSFSCPSPSS